MAKSLGNFTTTILEGILREYNPGNYDSYINRIEDKFNSVDKLNQELVNEIKRLALSDPNGISPWINTAESKFSNMLPVNFTSDIKKIISQRTQEPVVTPDTTDEQRFEEEQEQRFKEKDPYEQPLPVSMMDLVNQKYAPIEADLMKKIYTAAAKRGGLDAGGLLAATAEGQSYLGAQKAGEAIDYAKFLKTFELPEAQFAWQKQTYPEQMALAWAGPKLAQQQFAWEKNVKYPDYMKSMADLSEAYRKQQEQSQWSPLLSILGTAVGGPVGGAIGTGIDWLFKSIGIKK